jgi:tetratricopeptide (TPR) repeat protein
VKRELGKRSAPGKGAAGAELAAYRARQGWELLERGDVKGAERLLREAQRLDPESRPARWVWGLLQEQQGSYAEAIEAWEDLLRDRAEEAASIFRGLERVHFLDGSFSRMEQTYERFLRQFPDHADACFGLARFLRRKGQLDEAVEVCRRGLEAHPESAELQALALALLLQSGRIAEAEGRIDAWISRLGGERESPAGKRPGAVDVRTIDRGARAMKRIAMAIVPAAIAVLTAGALVASEHAPESSEVRSLADAIEHARGARDAEEALERWEDVLALEPPPREAAEALWMRGQASRALGLSPEAGAAFDRITREHKRDFDRGRAFLAKGLTELEGGEPRAALESLREAARSARDANDRAQAELASASANYRLGNVQEALRRFDRFQADHPRDERSRWAAWRAVICLRLLGRERDAVERTERLERDAPGSLGALLARQEVRMGGSIVRGAAPQAAARAEGAAGDGAP